MCIPFINDPSHMPDHSELFDHFMILRVCNRIEKFFLACLIVKKYIVFIFFPEFIHSFLFV